MMQNIFLMVIVIIPAMPCRPWKRLSVGASNLTLCDTNGGKLVSQLQTIVAEVKARFPDTAIGVHCHNDSGLGVAVSLAGVEAGRLLFRER